MKKITFTKSSIPLLLRAFDCKIDEAGLIAKESGEQILSPEGENLTIESFGGIVKSKKTGEPIFFKKGLESAIKIVEGEY